MKCGFGKTELKGVFREEWEYGTPLYCRILYLEQRGKRALVFAFDLAGTFHTEVRRFIKEISRITGVPENSVWYHELQIHATVGGDVMCGGAMDKLISRCAKEAQSVIARAEECECFACDADMGCDYTMNREQYVDGIGGVTVWRGLRFDENGVPFTRDKGVMLLRGYEKYMPEIRENVYFDNAVDQKAYLFVFKNKSGNVTGSVSRFAAHPDVAVLFEHSENPDRLKEYRYDYDWPGYMSEMLEEKLGGTSIYLNGPCADLAVKKDCVSKGTYAASAAECRRIASLIGERLLADHNAHAFRVDTEEIFDTATFEIYLPMKDDFPHSYAEARESAARVEKAQRALDKAVEENRPASEIKRLVDERWRAGHLGSMVFCSGGYTEEELASRLVPVQVTALRFGGYLFVGLPGESLVDMTLWLRSEFTGEKTIPVDQVNGYYNYLATPRSLTLGGYTYWASFVSRNAIPKLKRELYVKLKDFLGKK